MSQRELLMIPGPVPPSPGVLKALAAPPRPHYGAEWAVVWRSALDSLARLFGTTGRVLAVPGSGSAGLDAAITSVLVPGDRVLVTVNGYHGERLASIAAAHGAVVERIDSAWGTPVTAAQFALAAGSGPAPRAFIATHVETTTGVVNPVADIAATGRKAGALVLIDAVASLGGMAFAMDDWGIDIACASSQKCLGSTPGLAQIALNARALEAIAGRAEASRSWYLDLAVWLDFDEKWRDWHPYPVTVPTGTSLALDTALRELEADGLAARAAHNQAVGDRLRQGAAALGLRLLPRAEAAAPVVTALEVPGEGAATRLVDYLRDGHRIHVGAGFGSLAGRIVRVGHMSPSIGVGEVDALLAAIAAFMRSGGR